MTMTIPTRIIVIKINLYFKFGSLYKIPPNIIATMPEICFKMVTPETNTSGCESALNSN